MAKICMFIIASFDKPIYLESIRFKKKQLAKYGIPHFFVFDDLPPPEYKFDEHDLFFEKDPVNPPFHYFPNQFFVVNAAKRYIPKQNPHMIRKFLKALNYINENEYDFIVRTNLSTFINIPKLCKELDEYSKEKCMVLAPIVKLHLEDWDIYSKESNNKLHLFSGTCIMITPDLISILKMIDLNLPLLYKHCDDTVLSHILNKITKKTHDYFLMACNDPKTTLADDYHFENVTLFRIFNDTDRQIDLIHWRHLLKHIDGITDV